MNRLTYFLFGLVLLLFISCEQDASWSSELGYSKLFAYSEITSEDRIKVFVNTAPGLNTDDGYFYPKQQDAKVTLLKDGQALNDPGFRYISREKAFVSQGSFRPEPGVTYGLKVELLEDRGIRPISGTTIIPEVTAIDKYIVKHYKTKGISKDEKEFDIKVSLNINEEQLNRFVLKPFYRNASGAREELLIRNISKGSNACYYSMFNEGLLVEPAKLKGDIELNLVNKNYIPANFDVSEIKFELVSITDDAYQYYKTFSKQVASQAVSLSEPVITYSNFENGLGLFTGYANTINTIKL